jgi:ankyrin repeat protein
LAAARGRIDYVNLLLDRGAPVDARNDSGWTPLFYAVTQGHGEVAEALLARGADPNAVDRNGRPPMSHLIGDEEMKALLRRHGAR